MPRRAVRPASCPSIAARLGFFGLSALCAVGLGAVWPGAHAQAPGTAVGLVVGRNVNMVSGQTLPDGDPYLQRQNEPSVAASTRNPLHLLAGANDYRTVDIPGNFDDGETGDAWLGVFKSFDGGDRWKSTLLPGYPQDQSVEGRRSPLKRYTAGADPVVRPGTNGLLYYSGLAFNRGEGGESAIFVARYIDNNNKENGDPIAYVSTSIVAKSSGAEFLDKPWMAVDVPRPGAPVCRIQTTQPAPVLTEAGQRILDKRAGQGADGKAVSAAAQTIRTTRTQQGTPTGLPTPGITQQAAKEITQDIKAGTIYVAYAAITTTTLSTGTKDVAARIMFSRSDDCGVTWSAPVQISDPAHKVNQGATLAVDPNTGVVHVAWRQFGLDAASPDAIMTASVELTMVRGRKTATVRKARSVHRFTPAGGADQISPKLQRAHRMGDVNELVAIKPFDSGTAEDRFRTNAYPSMAIDDESRVYLAWTERGYGGARPDPQGGDARVVLVTSRNGGPWTAPRPVDSRTSADDLPGHQMMPSLSYSGGRLLIVYYDLRQDVSRVFGPFVSERDAIYTDRGPGLRHTIDVRAVQASKGDQPVFGPSVMVSQYLTGNLRGSAQVQQLQYNAPNLPLFQLGTVPFMGDYIDVAPAPAFVQQPDGQWVHNTATTAAPVFHAVWTDNRDVQKPPDGDWKSYTPPGADGCVPGRTGMRNQNVYSARITMGLVAGSPSNTKPLDVELPRGFVVFAQNTTYQTKAFRMTIENQPVGGAASFAQLGLEPQADLLLSVDVKVAPRSMVTRTVYATSSNAKEQVRVTVAEVDPGTFIPVEGGLATRVILNPDISNPDISNPDISNPDISNPDISNAEVSNPDISNPDISNPDISNPDISNPDISNPDISNIVIANPDISNPDISNPDISNPDISNPDISNPDISNPDISNGSLTDVTWTIRNDGNTTSAFNVNLFIANQAAATGGIKTQLVVHKTYKTPVSDGCVLKSQTQTVVVANVLNPTFKSYGDSTEFDPANPDISNTTLWLEPGGEGKITLRIVDPNPTDNIELNPVTDVTPVVQAQPINTPDLGTPTPEPPSTPLPTDPPAPSPTPQTTLTFVTQPAASVAGGPISDITISAFAGAAPQAGVQVTLAIAINPSGGKLSGVVTKLTDAAGLVTFTGLSIDRDGAGYRFSASAAAAGAMPVLSESFTVGAPPPPPPPPAGPWTAAGSGAVTLVDNGSAGTPRMTYQHNGAPNFNGAWALSSTAAGAGAMRLDWEWTGFHSWCASTVGLQVYVNRGGADVFLGPLLQYADGCNVLNPHNNPSAGFAFAGVTSVDVLAGDTYGFRLTGSHGDGSYALEGAFSVIVNGATSASPFVVTNASDGGPGSLRAAITAANAAPDVDTITFAIPGAWVHTIAPATPLPLIATPMIIDGLSQPGSASMAPMINIDGRFMQNFASNHNDDTPGTNIGRAPGFEVVASNVTIRGLGINRFPGPGVFVFNGTNNVRIEDSAIGAGLPRVLTQPASISSSIWLNYGINHVITRNVISSSQGSGILLVGGSGTSISGNRIGTSIDGLTALPNLDNGITMYDGTTGTLIDGNLISGNGRVGGFNGYGIDIQNSGGADVSNTVISNNVIGLNVSGALIDRGGAHYVDPGPAAADFGPVNRGNAGGGIRIQRGPGTVIGGNGGGNTISGNTGTGIRIEGAMAVAPVISRNRVGTNPAGTAALGNAVGIDVFLSTAVIGGPLATDRNIVSGNIRDGIAANGNTIIENNLVGTDATGTVALGNSPWNGPDCCHTNIFVNAPNNIVRRNVVAGNSAHPQNPGIRSGGASGAAPNIIEDNWVGTDTTGTLALGNGVGIGLFGDKAGTIVRRNVVAHNVTGGIWMVEGAEDALIGGAPGDGNIVRNTSGTGIRVGYNATAGDTRNVITYNLVYDNTGLGIDLGSDWVTANDAGDTDGGPNGSMNFPVLSNPSNTGPTTTVDLTADADTTNVVYFIQVYASQACHVSGYGEGRRLVGSFSRSSNGASDLVYTLTLDEPVSAGEVLTATMTRGASGGTSEFSQCVTVPAAPVLVPEGSAGGGGGTPFGPITCAAGSTGAGLRGHAGDDIDRTELWCREVVAGPGLGAESFAGGVGGFGGTNYADTLMCPAGSFMIGVHGRAGTVAWGGNVVDTLGVTCRNATTGVVNQTATVGALWPASVPFAITCPAGQEVIAIGGGQGGLLDRISIYCGDRYPGVEPAAVLATTFGWLAPGDQRPSRPRAWSSRRSAVLTNR